MFVLPRRFLKLTLKTQQILDAQQIKYKQLNEGVQNLKHVDGEVQQQDDPVHNNTAHKDYYSDRQ